LAATGYRCRKCWHWTWSMLDHDRYGSISGSFAALLERFYSIEPPGKSKNGRSRGVSGLGKDTHASAYRWTVRNVARDCASPVKQFVLLGVLDGGGSPDVRVQGLG